MRFIRALLLALVSALIASGVVYFAFVRPKVRGWGLDPGEAELPLPGDDLIPEPTHVETRGITINAPVAKVWPWLVQMGFGRAGWYSYDMLDNRAPSTDEVMPEFQSLAEGDVMPTHPGGGFLVKILRPEQALVLYTDTETLRSQAEAAQAGAQADTPAGLKVGGEMMSASFPEIRASWAFYLQADDGATRLIERFRAKTPGSGAATVVLGEIMGTGIVLMTRKQMLGIKERVERLEGVTAQEPSWPAHDLAQPAEADEPAEAPDLPTEPELPSIN